MRMAGLCQFYWRTCYYYIIIIIIKYIYIAQDREEAVTMQWNIRTNFYKLRTSDFILFFDFVKCS